MKVKVTYCSNYNGVSVEVDGEYIDYSDVKALAVMDAVNSFAADECSDEGEFYGDIDDVEDVAIKAVKRVYGPDVEVIFEEDSISS